MILRQSYDPCADFFAALTIASSLLLMPMGFCVHAGTRGATPVWVEVVLSLSSLVLLFIVGSFSVLFKSNEWLYLRLGCFGFHCGVAIDSGGLLALILLDYSNGTATNVPVLWRTLIVLLSAVAISVLIFCIALVVRAACTALITMCAFSPNQCGSCGYPAIVNAASPCPECGNRSAATGRVLRMPRFMVLKYSGWVITVAQSIMWVALVLAKECIHSFE